MTDRKQYFDVHPKDWDEIYNAPRGSARARLNRRLRRAVWGRMALTLMETADVASKTVLDVGCGPGELSIRLAERGASRVVGIDSAGEMIRVATARAADRGVADRCHFVHADFLSDALRDEVFDCTVALGVLDYVSDAPRFLQRMWSHTRGRMIVSFPRDVPPRSWVRRLWHGAHGSHLHYYSLPRALALTSELHAAATRVHSIPGSDSTDVLVCERAPSERDAASAKSPVAIRVWSASDLRTVLQGVWESQSP